MDLAYTRSTMRCHFSGMQTLGAFMWMEDLKGKKNPAHHNN